MASRPNQVWMGNIPITMSEVDIIEYIAERVVRAPLKVVVRKPSENHRRNSFGETQYGVASWYLPEDAQKFMGDVRAHGMIWPGWAHIVVRIYPYFTWKGHAVFHWGEGHQ